MANNVINCNTNTGTPPLTRFSYNTDFYLTRFFQPKNRAKFLSNTIFQRNFKNQKIKTSKSKFSDFFFLHLASAKDYERIAQIKIPHIKFFFTLCKR